MVNDTFEPPEPQWTDVLLLDGEHEVHRAMGYRKTVFTTVDGREYTIEYAGRYRHIKRAIRCNLTPTRQLRTRSG